MGNLPGIANQGSSAGEEAIPDLKSKGAQGWAGENIPWEKQPMKKPSNRGFCWVTSDN